MRCICGSAVASKKRRLLSPTLLSKLGIVSDRYSAEMIASALTKHFLDLNPEQTTETFLYLLGTSDKLADQIEGLIAPPCSAAVAASLYAALRSSGTCTQPSLRVAVARRLDPQQLPDADLVDAFLEIAKARKDGKPEISADLLMGKMTAELGERADRDLLNAYEIIKILNSPGASAAAGLREALHRLTVRGDLTDRELIASWKLGIPGAEEKLLARVKRGLLTFDECLAILSLEDSPTELASAIGGTLMDRRRRNELNSKQEDVLDSMTGSWATRWNRKPARDYRV